MVALRAFAAGLVFWTMMPAVALPAYATRGIDRDKLSPFPFSA
jgi:hypothetical protein